MGYLSKMKGGGTGPPGVAFTEVMWSWLGSFIGGQRSAEALRDIDAFLARHPQLPTDLRQKILQTRDDLERTVRIRAKYAAGAAGATTS